jgi:hypothetical protein
MVLAESSDNHWLASEATRSGDKGPPAANGFAGQQNIVDCVHRTLPRQPRKPELVA